MNKILLSSLVAASLFIGCTENKEEKKVEAPKVEEKAEVKVEKKVEVVKVEEKKEESKTEIAASVDLIKKASTNIGSTVSKAVDDVTKTVSETTKEVVEKTAPVIEEKTKEVVAVVEKSVAEIKKTVIAEKPKVNGAAIYAACASCHGQDASKAALGKSQIIKGWAKDKVLAALKGYKDGSYGGPMKAIMKGQVASKSDEELDALADHISKL